MCCFINLHQCRYCSHGSVKSLHDCHTTYCGVLLVNHVLMCVGTKLCWKIHCGYIQVMKLNAALCSVDSCHLQAAYFKNSKVISTRKWQAFVWAWMSWNTLDGSGRNNMTLKFSKILKWHQILCGIDWIQKSSEAFALPLGNNTFTECTAIIIPLWNLSIMCNHHVYLGLSTCITLYRPC